MSQVVRAAEEIVQLLDDIQNDTLRAEGVIMM